MTRHAGTGKGQMRAKAKAATMTKAEVDAAISEKEEKFCYEYVYDFNGTKAARRAGYSQNAARTEASRLLRLAHVQARIGELKELRRQRMEVSADNVLRELSRLAFSDLRRTVSWDKKGVRLKSSRLLADDDAAALSEISITEGPGGKKTMKVKLHDKTPNLHLLAKHVGIGAKDDDDVSPEEKAEHIRAMLEKMDEQTGGKDEQDES